MKAEQPDNTLHELKGKVSPQELYSILVEKASDGFWLLNRDFTTAYVNPAIEEILGYAKEEMIGRSWYEFGDPEWVARAQELERRRTKGVKEPHTFLFIHKDGRKVLTRIATTPLFDEKGEFNGAIGILSNITRQHEADEALKVKDLLNAIAKSCGIGICLTDADYTISWYNDIYAKWFGPLENAKGRNCFEMFEGRNGICPDCPAKATFETGTVATSIRSGITLPEGPDRIVSVTASPICGPGGTVLQIVEIAQDITEQKQNEEKIRNMNIELDQRVKERTQELESASQEMEAFTYSVSHDLRAPLRHINAFSTALKEECSKMLDEQGCDYLDRICASSTHLAILIDDLLKFSRVSRSEMCRTEVDLSALAQKIADMMREAEPERKVEFRIDKGLVVHGDPVLLEIVLQNLMINAWKYSSRNPLAVIEVGRTGDSEDKSFYVRDNGVGFDMAYSHKLFKVFERLHGEEFEGTGIGLATVQRILNRHGGKIRAEGAVGKGATFYFSLPAVE